MRGYMVMVFGLETRKYWEPAWLELFTRKRDAQKKLRQMRAEHHRPELRWGITPIQIAEEK